MWTNLSKPCRPESGRQSWMQRRTLACLVYWYTNGSTVNPGGASSWVVKAMCQLCGRRSSTTSAGQVTGQHSTQRPHRPAWTVTPGLGLAQERGVQPRPRARQPLNEPSRNLARSTRSVHLFVRRRSVETDSLRCAASLLAPLSGSPERRPPPGSRHARGIRRPMLATFAKAG